MRILQIIASLFGRVFISGFFLLSAFHKIINWQETETGFVSLLCDWHNFAKASNHMQEMFSWLLGYVSILVVLAVVFEIVGAVMILFGWKPKLGAFLLLMIFIPMTILLHHFWLLDGVQKEMQFALFLKNVAIMGGLFFVLAFGSKVNGNTNKDEPFSLDGSSLNG